MDEGPPKDDQDKIIWAKGKFGKKDNLPSRLKRTEIEMVAQRAEDWQKIIIQEGMLHNFLRPKGYPNFQAFPESIVQGYRKKWELMGFDELANILRELKKDMVADSPVEYMELFRIIIKKAKRRPSKK